MQVPVYNATGEVVENIEINDDVFALPFHKAVVHQALVRQLANQRQGTVATKTRSEVTGSSRKLSAQKHTGRARRGSMGSPVLKGGGVAFGPHQRSYRQAMPKKMRRLALRSVLSSKCSEGGLKVLNDMQMEHPKTKAFSGILRALGIDGSVLLATGKVEPNVVKSARNLPRVSVIPAALLNVADILAHCNLIMTVDAIRKAEAIWISQETKKTSDETPQPRNDKE